MSYFFYILVCSDNSFYAGSTSDLEERIERHNQGKASQWTKNRRPVRLVYSEEYPTQLQAMRRERQVKNWSKNKKNNLITGFWNKPIK